MKITGLQELGLSEGQIKVYEALLELGSGNLNSIHEKTGIERRNIYDILNKLIERGFVTYTIEKGKRSYRCAHPRKILEDVREKQVALHILEEQIPKLTDAFESFKHEVHAEVYRGTEGIKSLLNELLEHKESFWLGGNSFENYTAVPEHLQTWFAHWMDRRVEQKHIMHDLVSHGAYLKGLSPSQKKEHKKMHYEFKSLPEGMYVPMVIVIFGNRVAQILWGAQPFAFVLESHKVSESYMRYFRYFWEDSKR